MNFKSTLIEQLDFYCQTEFRWYLQPYIFCSIRWNILRQKNENFQSKTGST